MGGKHALAPWIITKMIPHKKFVDVFAGGLHITLNKEISEFNIVNDINKNLINVYKVIYSTKQRKELSQLLDMGIYSKEVFNFFREIYESTEKFNKLKPVLRAFMYIYLNRVSFNGKGKNYAQRDDANIYGLEQIIRMMQRKFIAGKFIFDTADFVEIIERHAKDESVLFYLDPPYYVTSTSKGADYYEHIMKIEDHIRLRDALLSKTKMSNWLLSYDDHPEIRRLYNQPNVHMIKTPAKCQTSGNAIAGQKEQETVYKQELLIANYPIEDVNTLFE